MRKRLKVGVVLPTYRRLANPANIKRAAELSEALGFDSVWVTDHVVVPASSLDAFGATFFEAVTTMAYLAGITTRVEIGAAILIVPYRHPLLLAKMLASADQLSGGRMIAGVGLGWLESESALMGVQHNRRARIADEALAVMRACWQSETPEFTGETYQVKDLHFAPRPHRERHLPVLVGGASKAALRRAARLGDGWIGDTLTFEELETSVAELTRELSEVGRKIDDVEVAMRTGLQVADDASEVTDSPSETGWKTGDFAAAGRSPFRGLRAEVVADFKRAAELGVDHLIFEFPVSRGEESMYLFETLASIREEAGV
jgi:probable F420-dependent oxidoreductase